MVFNIFGLFFIFCVIFALIVTGKSGKIFLGSLIIIGVFVTLAFPSIKLYMNIVFMIIGLGCLIYLISGGYMYNLRLLRFKKPHDRV